MNKKKPSPRRGDLTEDEWFDITALIGEMEEGVGGGNALAVQNALEEIADILGCDLIERQ
jgi:hypothetical protein